MPGSEPRIANLLTFDLEGQRSAVLATDVLEVQRAVAMTVLPRGPPLVEGVIDLRGKLVPVLDIRARLGLRAHSLALSDQFVIVRVSRGGTGQEAGSRVVAIRVDRALELVPVPMSMLEDPRTVAGAAEVAGAAKLPDGLLLIHDLRRFLSLEEELRLDRALEGSPA
ncbi:MAG TPA: chemotaxis protein CheW [Myxococcales bacterium]|nr:chemotaxis protein CheW [Myxococcales bacterium]